MFQISSIYFYEKTVKKLTEDQKNQYHEENSIAAEMVLVDRKIMPKTHKELKDWVIEKSREKDYLVINRCCHGCCRHNWWWPSS